MSRLSLHCGNNKYDSLFNSRNFLKYDHRSWIILVITHSVLSLVRQHRRTRPMHDVITAQYIVHAF